MPRVTITVPEKTAQPYRFQLDHQSVTLGRGSENDIIIDCGSVSVQHAVMRRVAGGYELRDMGSTNGIKLDDERYESVPLRNGMSLQLGDVTFDFMLTAEEREELAQEQPAVDQPVQQEAEKSLPKLPPMPEAPPEPEMEPVFVPATEDKRSCGFWIIMLLVLVILAAAAFFGGMVLRGKQEPASSSFRASKSNNQLPVTPAPSTSNITPPVAPPTATPVTPPAEPPVAPPATPPVTPPAEPPVAPPAAPPVTPPAEPPVAPPAATPVTPPVTPPVAPPAAPAETPVTAPAVTPFGDTPAPVTPES